MTETLIRNFFAAADSLDAERFGAVLPDDIIWRFGNFPTANGRDAVLSQYAMIVDLAETMHHDIIGIWRDQDCITAETRVHYKDRYGRQFSYPGCDIIFVDGSVIKEVRIFVDNHEMFIPPQADISLQENL